MAASTLSLFSLPPELLLEVADYLPPDGILALKLTHRIFNYSLPLAPRLRNRPLSRCARLAVRSYLAKPTSNPTHLRCILCKIVYPLKSFKSSSSPACASSSFTANVEQAEVVELPHRLCAWHVGRLVRIVQTKSNDRNEWVASLEKMCMHCGAIQSWAKCECSCDSCAVEAVTAYTRFLNNKTECKTFVFYRKSAIDNSAAPEEMLESSLFVRETCSRPGFALQNSVIHMPVQCHSAHIFQDADDA